MRTCIVILALSLAACGGKGGAGSKAVTLPSTPAAPGSGGSGGSSPVINWPLAGAEQTVTLGSLSCSTFAAGLKCTQDAGVTNFSIGALGSSHLTSIAVGSTVICGLTEPNGPAADCTDLSDPACTAPASLNQTYCFNVADLSVIGMDQGTQLGFGAPAYATGTKALSVDVSGNMCLDVTIYNAGSTFVQNTSVCGNDVNSLGYIQ